MDLEIDIAIVMAKIAIVYNEAKLHVVHHVHLTVN